MDSKEEHGSDGHRHNTTATENSDTTAMQKKRARRVSFAEMTSVHFFDRDEEYNETPLTETENIRGDLASELGFGELLGGNKEFGGENDGNDSDDDEEMEMRRSFLRPVGSPSPGGSTIGSASSGDEDSFFGPVSANFIRPGRLSDSAASDDNCDVTMDSTTFSMHYRSLAKSDSGVDLKTPTGSQLIFEERTPVGADAGSSMVLTLGKKPVPKSSIILTEVSGSHNSNDMSLVGENPNKYDYEKLSPGLDALLEESRKNLLSVGASDDVTTSTPPMRNESEVLPSLDHGDNLVNLSDYVKKETGWIDSEGVLNGDKPAARSELGKANVPLGSFPNGLSPQQFSSATLEDAASERDNHKSNRSPYQLAKDESETALVASISPVKQQQIVLATASPRKHLVAGSPLPEQSGSLLRSKSVEHQETQTSIRRSISKLESLEKAAFSSTFAARVDSSTIKSLDFLKSPNFVSFSEKNRHISRLNGDSVAAENLAGVSLSKEGSYAFNMDHKRVETLNSFGGEIMSRNSPNELNARSRSVEQQKYRGAAASPTKITWSGNNLKRSLFTSRHSDDDALMTEIESLLAEIASGESGKAVCSPKYVFSSDRILNKKLSASPGLQSSQSEDLLLDSQFKQISGFEKGQHSTPEKNPPDVNLSSVTVNQDAVCRGMKRELNSPFVEVNHLKKFVEVKATATEEIDIYNGKEMSGDHSTNLNVGNQTIGDISMFEHNLPGGDFKVVSHGYASPSFSGHLEEPRLQKNLVESPTPSFSRKVLDNNQSPKISSPKTTLLGGRQENISANKRNIELLLRDTQHRSEMIIMQRSPKFRKGECWDPPTLLYPNEGRTTVAGHEGKKWTDIYSKFSEDMKNMISGSADELNSKTIDLLEDMLVHQQRLKKYELLLLGVMHESKIVLGDLQLEKMAEAKSLLHQVVFQKAKMRLKHVKKEILLKRSQLLNSRIQELEILRANIASQPLKTSTSNVLVNAVSDSPLPVDSKKQLVVCREKLTAMRQDLEALNRKILKLTRTFHACCKMKAEPSCGETIVLVNEHLIKRASCRFIRLDMQMWLVHRVGSSDGHHNVTLNYIDFIIQSIKIIVGPTSSAAVSYELNETNIIKNFPNMDACIAFGFVFNAETACRFVGAKTLAQQTQVTSSLLGTLLDVVEEVKLAQIEFQNLTQSSFCSPSVGQLNLVLSFFNFNSGRTVTLTLDMTCLKRGIYPSEILPLGMESTVNSWKCSSSVPIFDEIRGAVKGVRTGYMRILRLCRCASRAVQASTALHHLLEIRTPNPICMS